MQQPDSPLQQYLEIIKRQLTLVLIVPIVAVGVTYLAFDLKDPEYEASTSVVAGEPRIKANPVLGSVSITRTMTALLEGDYVSRATMKRLGLEMTLREFQKPLKVEVLPETSVLNISYVSTDPELALNVVTQLYRTFERRIRTTLGTKGNDAAVTEPGGSFALIVRMFDEPHVDELPVARTSALMLAFIGGLILGILLAVARNSLDFRVQGRREAEEWFRAPVVGALPKPPAVGLGGRWSDRREAAHAASLDLLRARLEFTQLRLAGPTIVVTSGAPDEGKSTVAASLGTALARGDKRVICVDADLRRPSLPGYLGVDVEGSPGLIEVLQERVDLDDALLPIELAGTGERNGHGPHAGQAKAEPRLQVLPAGATAPGSVLMPDAVKALIRELHRRADYVVFDSPPLMVADSFALALEADNVLLVAQRGRTTRDEAEWARATLDGLGIENISVVLTNASSVETYT